MTLGHWQALEFLRRRKHLDPQAVEDIAYIIAVESVAHHAVDNMPSRDIEDVLRLLRPRASSLIREYYYQGITVEDLASKYEIKPGSVKVAISRALEDMRKIMII